MIPDILGGRLALHSPPSKTSQGCCFCTTRHKSGLGVITCSPSLISKTVLDAQSSPYGLSDAIAQKPRSQTTLRAPSRQELFSRGTSTEKNDSGLNPGWLRCQHLCEGCLVARRRSPEEEITLRSRRRRKRH